MQHDSDFPHVARIYDWSGDDDATEAVWEAYDFLDCNVGESVDDPDYF